MFGFGRCKKQGNMLGSVGDQNRIDDLVIMSQEERATEMAKTINRCVTVNGKKKWVHAKSEQDYAEKLLKLFGNAENEVRTEPTAEVMPTKSVPTKHKFKDYAQNWFEVYSKPNIEKATATTYQRQLDLHLNPVLGLKAIEDISTDDIQKLFNRMSGAKTTKQKARVVLNMILESAVEDGLLVRNPLQSRRIKINGAASKYTKEYSVDQMRYLVLHLKDILRDDDRMFLAIQALHPLRLEEVLGLKWADIDLDSMTIYVRRAVTHPTRNLPEIKATKTEASNRMIGLSSIAAHYLVPGDRDQFIFGGEKPLSYQQVKRMCWRIQKDTGFEENITPIRFRTTVLTDIYDQTKDVKAAQAAAGHTTSAMTLKHYVKGRSGASESTAAIDRIYGAGQ